MKLPPIGVLGGLVTAAALGLISLVAVGPRVVAPPTARPVVVGSPAATAPTTVPAPATSVPAPFPPAAEVPTGTRADIHGHHNARGPFHGHDGEGGDH